MHAEHLPLGKTYFDVDTCSSSHFPFRARTLQQTNKVTDATGHLLLSYKLWKADKHNTKEQEQQQQQQGKCHKVHYIKNCSIYSGLFTIEKLQGPL